MKKITCLLLGLCLSSAAFSQSEDVPPSVMEAFFKQAPYAYDVFWEFREGAYVGMYAGVDGLKKVFLEESGQWLETRTRMEREALPAAVLAFIDRHYGTADITYIGRVDQPEGTLYRVESELPTAVVIKLLNEKGQLLEEKKIEWGPFFGPATGEGR